jgi:hypothetical protein
MTKKNHASVDVASVQGRDGDARKIRILPDGGTSFAKGTSHDDVLREIVRVLNLVIRRLKCCPRDRSGNYLLTMTPAPSRQAVEVLWQYASQLASVLCSSWRTWGEGTTGADGVTVTASTGTRWEGRPMVAPLNSLTWLILMPKNEFPHTISRAQARVMSYLQAEIAAFLPEADQACGEAKGLRGSWRHRTRPRRRDSVAAERAAEQYRAGDAILRRRGHPGVPTDREVYEAYRALPEDERGGSKFPYERWRKLIGMARRNDTLPPKKPRLRMSQSARIGSIGSKSRPAPFPPETAKNKRKRRV